jgi:hypothetical protein
MSEPPKGIGVLKKRAIKYGRKVVRIQIGRSRDDHTIFGDQICNHSTFFRSALQPKRKPIEGTCSIYHDSLQPGIKELTFCAKQCGITFHYDCIQKWKKKRGNEALICPNCRATWPADTDTIKVFPELDVTGFEIYLHWILHQEICMETTEPGKGDLRTLIKAYLLGEHIADAPVRLAVLQGSLKLYKELGRYPGLALVRFAYEQSKPRSGLRKFVVQVYMLAGSTKWLDFDNLSKFPVEFMRDLTISLLRVQKMQRKETEWDLEAAKNNICGEEERKDVEERAGEDEEGLSLSGADEEL